MNASLISQFSNSKDGSSIASVLISILRSSTFPKLRAMVAFANYGGISGLADEFSKSNTKDKSIIVGIDNKITSVEALSELISLGFDGRIYHTSGSEIFHPKFYLFENDNEFTLIIGSNNLTTGGLVMNDECAVLIQGTKDELVYKQADEAYNQIWNTNNKTDKPIVMPLNEEVIGELYVQEYIPSESDAVDKLAIPSDYEASFGLNPQKEFPLGFSPKSLSSSSVKEIILLPHNQAIYNEILKFLSSHNKGYVVQPTGTGKSYLMAKYITDHISQKIMVVAPNNIILEEMKKILGKSINNVVYATYQYLSADLNRTRQMAKTIEHILIDEFHHLGAEGWGNAVKTLINNAKSPKVIGFSATPKRDFDDINVTELFFEDNCIHELTLFEAWREKILPVPQLVQSYVEIDEVLNNLENEVSEKQKLSKTTRKTLHEKLEEIKSKYIADTSLQKVIKDYIPKDTKKIIVFVPQIDTMDETEKRLTPCIEALGVKAHNFHVHSQRGKKENEKQLELFHHDYGGINLIYSVDMLIEGLHVDGVDALILLRSTNSVRIALQQLGRCLSSGKKKKPIVLDIVNNYRAKEIFGITADGVRRHGEDGDESSNIYIQGNYMEINEAISNLLAKYNSWEENFKMLLEFKQTYGRAPKGNDNCPRLFYWWGNQKKLYREGKLEDEKIRIFLENGFELDHWETMLNELKDFKEKNNRFPTRKDGTIGNWYYQQGVDYREGKLSDTRKKKLLNIDAKLIVKKDWLERLAELKRFIKDNGREPRAKAKDSAEASIYGWLSHTRQDYREGLLSKSQIHAFQEIGVPLDSTILERELEDRFERTCNQIEAFVDKHHRLPKYKEDRKLYNRILGERQKIKRGTMPPERVERLRVLGVYSETEEEWKENYNRILLFINANGRKPYYGEDKWWDQQVFAYKKIAINRSGLSDEQIKLLDDIDVLGKKDKKKRKQ